MGISSEVLHDFFKKHDTDHNGALDYNELHQMLTTNQYIKMQADAVTMLMHYFDKDYSENISWSEFEEMWRYLERFKASFNAYDEDNSGFIDKNEMLNVIGRYNQIPDHTADTVMQTYSRTKPGQLTFDEYIKAIAYVHKLSKNK